MVAPPFVFAAVVALGVALVLAQVWFFHYGELFSVGDAVWLVLARDVLLVAVYGVLVAAVLRLRTMIPSSSSTVSHAPLTSSRASGTAVVDSAERRSR